MSDQKSFTLYNCVRTTSDAINTRRTPDEVMLKVVEEVGELALETAIHTGKSYKAAGKDGIIGETADVIIATLDLLFIAHPDITEREFVDIVQSKLNKWKEKERAARVDLENRLFDSDIQ